MQEWLDAGMGACHMRRPDVRAAVEGCLQQFDGKRYDIDAFVLMPNHVHAVIKPTPGSDLSTALQGDLSRFYRPLIPITPEPRPCSVCLPCLCGARPPKNWRSASSENG